MIHPLGNGERGESMTQGTDAGLARLARHINDFSEWTGRAISWLTLAMVVVTFVVVILRYLFNVGWIAMQETITWMHALVFMLGAAYTLSHDGHVRVDIFYRSAPPRAKAWVDLLGTLLLLLPVCAFIAWTSWGYVASAWAVHESSGETGGLPGLYLLKTVMLVMPGLMVLQGLALVARKLLVLLGRTDEGGAP